MLWSLKDQYQCHSERRSVEPRIMWVVAAWVGAHLGCALQRVALVYRRAKKVALNRVQTYWYYSEKYSFGWSAAENIPQLYLRHTGSESFCVYRGGLIWSSAAWEDWTMRRTSGSRPKVGPFPLLLFLLCEISVRQLQVLFSDCEGLEVTSFLVLIVKTIFWKKEALKEPVKGGSAWCSCLAVSHSCLWAGCTGKWCMCVAKMILTSVTVFVQGGRGWQIT